MSEATFNMWEISLGKRSPYHRPRRPRGGV